MISKEKTDALIDKAIESGRKADVPPTDLEMLHQVFRPFCHVLSDAQETGVTPAEACKAVSLFVANAVGETILRMVERTDVDGATELAQGMLNDTADQLAAHLNANMSKRQQ